MRQLALAILVLLLGLIAGRYLAADPGFVVIGYAGKLVRMSFALFALLMLLCCVFLYALVRLVAGLLSARARVARWRTQRRRDQAERALEQGYLALAAGDWPRAERLFSEAAQGRLASPVHLLGAAQAAHAQQQAARRDRYLTLAQDMLPGSDGTIRLKRAEILLDEGRRDEALELLRELKARAPRNRQVLSLLRRLYVDAGNWQAVLDDLLPALRTAGAAANEQAELRRIAYRGLFQDGADGDPAALWAKIPRAEQADPELIGAYAEALMRRGAASQCELLLRRALRAGYDANLVESYGRLEGADVTRQIDFAESLLATHPDDSRLLLALGRLNHRQSLWGAAKTHLERLIKTQPSPEAYRLLAEVFEALHDRVAAERCYRSGLQLAVATDVERHGPAIPERSSRSSASAAAAPTVPDRTAS